MTRVFIAIGTNVGNRTAQIAAALAALAARADVSVLRLAKVIETEPVGCPPGSPAFLNTAAELVTSLDPFALLAVLHETELALGRERSVPNAPRTLDLDLLLYGDEVVESPQLTLPHPRLHERRFVLAPLAEIAADVTHPTLHRTIAQLLAELDECESGS